MVARHGVCDPADLVKTEMLIAGESVDAFARIVHRSKAESCGRALAAKLKEVIPQQLFVVSIQAAIGGKIIHRQRTHQRPEKRRHRQMLRRRHQYQS
nr:hypothetical protein [Phragmitibacter flavus]